MFRRGLADALESDLPDINFSLACLPSRRGGLGFRNPDFVLAAAFLASHLDHAREEEVDEPFWSEFRNGWGNFSAAFGIDEKIVQRLISASQKDIEKEMSKQRWWQNIVNDAIGVRVPQSSISSVARLRALQKLNAAHCAVEVT